MRLGDQPRVFNRNHCLHSEVLQQSDLLVGKSPNLLAVDHEDAKDAAVFAQRDRYARSGPAKINRGATQRAVPVIFGRCEICYVYELVPAHDIAQGS